MLVVRSEGPRDLEVLVLPKNKGRNVTRFESAGSIGSVASEILELMISGWQ